MPALRLFGRKWLAASDDLVFPCLFEVVFRVVWLILFGVAVEQSWQTINQCADGRLPVQIYLLGCLALVVINILLSALLVNRSAQVSELGEREGRRRRDGIDSNRIELNGPICGWLIDVTR